MHCPLSQNSVGLLSIFWRISRDKWYSTNMKIVTLLFLLKPGYVLLAMKKRGIGAGKWNGVGGKVEANETPEEATIRECQEEIGVTPGPLKKMAEIEFLIPSQDYHTYDHTYTATEWTGEIVETEEMAPQWFKLDEIPYDRMWSDDILWLPKVLSGQSIRANFIFDEHENVSDSLIEPHNWD
jgi:8-oxo-dGTP diphosphatase